MTSFLGGLGGSRFTPPAPASPGGQFSGAHFYPISPNGNSTGAAAIGSLRLCPRYWPGGWITAVGAEVTTAGDAGSVFLPVIAADSGQGTPGQIVVAGSISAAAIATLESAVPGGLMYLPPGYYHWGGVAQNSVGVPNMRTVAANTTGADVLVPGSVTLAAAGTAFGVAIAGMTGALPATLVGQALGINGTGPARIFVKLA